MLSVSAAKALGYHGREALGQQVRRSKTGPLQPVKRLTSRASLEHPYSMKSASRSTLSRSTRRWFDDKSREVVGIVVDVKTPRVLQLPTGPQVYWPLGRYYDSMTVLMRTQIGSPTAVSSLIASLDPDVVVEVVPLRDVLGESFVGTRTLTSIIAGIALLAIALTVGGVYGVLSKFAAQQRAQVALRMVLGANRGDVRFWVIWKGLSKVLAGIVIGVLSSYPVARLVVEQLQDVEVNSLATRMVAGVLVLGVTVFAMFLPAVRASRVEPAEALKGG